MSFFKCKMCGGTIEFEQGATVGVCDSCGTKQTLPRLDDDRKTNLYDRANHFRRNNDYDKAAGIYESILNEDTTDAEAYWSLVLCKYGIEYVEDPATKKRVPTVNRAQFTSVFDDDNYKSALKYADNFQRAIYESEANAINEIQKGILAISQKEEPFDVFICYKETDNNGRRTPDSVLANDLYHLLVQEGFKVFFSRITLEDKLGTAYEPYIFAALNSAKVMVVLGTKPEYFNAVWVKNEWSRYLSLVKQSGGKKVLIPAYRDMDPYDLPDEFSHLQAQDMSKLGFMQDLIRGIKKLTVKDTPTPTVVKETIVREQTSSGGANVSALLKRAFMFLEDGEWARADALCEQVLNQDPENAQAYLGKLMAEFQVKKQDELANCEQPFDTSNNYQKTILFGNDSIKNELNGYLKTINERNEQKRLESIYNEANHVMNNAESEESFLKAARLFGSISEHYDSEELSRDCSEKAAECRKRELYNSAVEKMNEDSIGGYNEAIDTLSTILGWSDTDEKIEECKKRIEEINNENKRKKERRKKLAIMVVAAVLAISVLIGLLSAYIIPGIKYSSAKKQLENKEYLAAMSSFDELDGFNDSKEMSKEARYLYAISMWTDKKYDSALSYLQTILDYKDSSDKYYDCGLEYAKHLESSKNYTAEADVLQDVIDNVYNKVNSEKKDEIDKLKNECYYKTAKSYKDSGNYDQALEWYRKTSYYDMNSDFAKECYYKMGSKKIISGDFKDAVTYFTNAKDYSDAKERANEARYKYCSAHRDSNDWTTIEYIKYLKEINYKDSSDIYNQIFAWKAKVIINDDENDTETDMDSISKYNNWYCHVELSGGPPQEMTYIKAVGEFPDGNTHTQNWDDKWGDGYGGYCWFFYTNPQYGKQGTFTVRIYDGNGNEIGSNSIKITG